MIKIGTTLTLEAENEDGETHRYRCKVVEMKGSTIYIDYPINEQSGRTSIFPKGTIFQANFIGNDQSIYQFDTEIKGKKTANLPMLLLHFPKDDLKRIQRREYVRVLTTLDVSIHHANQIDQPFTTITYDISGGGLAIILPSNHAVEPGKTVYMWLVLPMQSGETIYVTAEAEAIRTYQKKESDRQLLSMKFTNINEKDRQKIIRYCFEIQLRERRKDL
ncbi:MULTISPECIES: flagellar brake protein [Paraliobacillus]|uniref:flagellar brake protein n=1 Tax=Paraliobacillus TaxID=200903 RepID=UPI000DD4E4DF|nr:MULTISPECIES: flagellar brake domain-containing protein [Paraliobacillus]